MKTRSTRNRPALNRKQMRRSGLFDALQLRQALIEAFKMLDPRRMMRNPVMFVSEMGALLATISGIASLTTGEVELAAYQLSLSAILWLTVLFANSAESLAEVRGKAQAKSLRAMGSEIVSRRKKGDSLEEGLSPSELREGDLVVVRSGETIPLDGEVVEGAATVDESAITGESAPVIREAGGDRSGVTGGTRVISDEITVKITSESGHGFLDQMIALVEGANRQKTPNELALTVILAGLSLAFLIVVVALYPMARFFHLELDLPTVIGLFVCLIPTTIGGLLAAIGLAGMNRALQANLISKSGKAVEVAGDIDTILLDKTGTITLGNRKAVAFLPLDERLLPGLVRAAYLASMSDATPEGKSTVELARSRDPSLKVPEGGHSIEFSASTRLSGFNAPDGVRYRKGAPDAIKEFAGAAHGSDGSRIDKLVNTISARGGTPLLVCRDDEILGAISLEDKLKDGIERRIARLRKAGLRIIMVTGDNPITAEVIGQQAGVDQVIAEARPENKLEFIRQEQKEGRLVAMVGDGTNDAPALAQADIGLAMNSGTQAAREAGNMVDLDNDPTKLLSAIEIGKQMLMTRGALTTFSIANDVAKYFAIIPALFVATMGHFESLNFMQLHSPNSAVLSAVIFNAIIIPLLVPLALRGVRYKPAGAATLLRRNILVYGLGGLWTPFIGIKLLDLALAATGLFA